MIEICTNIQTSVIFRGIFRVYFNFDLEIWVKFASRKYTGIYGNIHHIMFLTAGAGAGGAVAGSVGTSLETEASDIVTSVGSTGGVALSSNLGRRFRRPGPNLEG